MCGASERFVCSGVSACNVCCCCASVSIVVVVEALTCTAVCSKIWCPSAKTAGCTTGMIVRTTFLARPMITGDYSFRL